MRTIEALNPFSAFGRFFFGEEKSAMLFRIRFHADAEVIASICLHEHRENKVPLIKRKIHCQRTVGQHFQAYGESLVSTGDMVWWDQLDLNSEEDSFVDWCVMRRW